MSELIPEQPPTEAEIVRPPADENGHRGGANNDFGVALAWLKSGKNITRPDFGEGACLFLAEEWSAKTAGLGNLRPNWSAPTFIGRKGPTDRLTPWAPSTHDLLAEDWILFA